MGWIFTIRTISSILGLKGTIVYGVGIYGVERSWFASPLHAISTVGAEETKLSSGEGNKCSCSALGDNVLDDVDYLIPFNPLYQKDKKSCGYLLPLRLCPTSFLISYLLVALWRIIPLFKACVDLKVDVPLQNPSFRKCLLLDSDIFYDSKLFPCCSSSSISNVYCPVTTE
jgi:hypothetical protein